MTKKLSLVVVIMFVLSSLFMSIPVKRVSANGYEKTTEVEQNTDSVEKENVSKTEDEGENIPEAESKVKSVSEDVKEETITRETYNAGYTGAVLPKISKAEIKAEELVEGTIPTLTVNSDGAGEVQYRVYVYAPEKKVWEDVTGGYTSKYTVGQEVNLKLNRPLHKGENSFSVWVKRNGQAPADKGGYDTFVSYRVTPKAPHNYKLPKITSVDIEKAEQVVGGKPTITLKADSEIDVEYSVYLYSQTKKEWYNVSKGYTSATNPNAEKSIKIDKELQPGRNTFSIWVKKAGYNPEDAGGYDTFVTEVVNTPETNEDFAKITSAKVDESKLVVGNKPEITVTGISGDESDISYRAFLYSNNQKKWLDGTAYISDVKSGESIKLALSAPLEEGTNKVLIWAKRTSTEGEVYESFKEIEIDSIKPAPLKKKIVVDPGHGGKDPGAVSTAGTRERDIVLSVGVKLGNLLKSAGYDILYTRTSNDSVDWDSSNQNASLRYRYTYANDNGADLFVSIHCNSAGATSANGTETFYSSKNPNKDKAFTTSVHNALVKSIGLTNRGVKSGNFSVINNTKMSATLVELAFISNKSDEAKLKDSAFQDKCAQGIYNGIVNY